MMVLALIAITYIYTVRSTFNEQQLKKQAHLGRTSSPYHE